MHRLNTKRKIKLITAISIVALLFGQNILAQVPGPVGNTARSSTPTGSTPSGTPGANPQTAGAPAPGAGSSAPTAPATAVAITVDLGAHTISGDIPYDQPFYLVVTDVDSQIVKLEFNLMEGLNTGTGTFKLISTAIKFGNSFYLPYYRLSFNKQFLLPNKNYTLQILAFTSTAAGASASTALSFMAGFYTKTKAGDLAKTDFGLGYAPGLRSLIGFSTVHFYFTPINDNTDIQDIKDPGREILVRTSIFMGISPLTLSQATAEPISNRFGLGNFVFGIGIRSPFYGWGTTDSRVGEELLQPMRLTIGEMLFKQTDANPLITKMQNKCTVYFGLSYDLNIASILGPVGKLLTP